MLYFMGHLVSNSIRLNRREPAIEAGIGTTETQRVNGKSFRIVFFLSEFGSHEQLLRVLDDDVFGVHGSERRRSPLKK